eukprot:UN05453
MMNPELDQNNNNNSNNTLFDKPELNTLLDKPELNPQPKIDSIPSDIQIMNPPDGKILIGDKLKEDMITTDIK